MCGLHLAVVSAFMAVMDFLGIGAHDLSGAESPCNCPAYPAEMRIGRTTLVMVYVLLALHVFPAWFAMCFFAVLIGEKHADR